MKNVRLVLVFARYLMIGVALLLLPPTVRAEQSDEPKPAEPATAKAEAPVDKTQRDKQFTELLTGVVLEGAWQVAPGDNSGGKAPLGEAHTDRYTIDAVQKVGDDQWIVGARVEFMEKDVTLPVPVRVIWAGDTPVITLDSMDLPGLGRYSARVMFHHGYYSGVWYADNYGGVLSGRIIKREEIEKQEGEKADNSGDK